MQFPVYVISIKQIRQQIGVVGKNDKKNVGFGSRTD